MWVVFARRGRHSAEVFEFKLKFFLYNLFVFEVVVLGHFDCWLLLLGGAKTKDVQS